MERLKGELYSLMQRRQEDRYLYGVAAAVASRRWIICVICERSPSLSLPIWRAPQRKG